MNFNTDKIALIGLQTLNALAENKKLHKAAHVSLPIVEQALCELRGISRFILSQSDAISDEEIIRVHEACERVRIEITKALAETL